MTDVLAEVTPLPGSAAASVVWRRQGQLYVTVIVKATFAFAPDTEMPETEPQEILRADVHHGHDPRRSVRFTSDLSPYLARADVLFTGHAHAPGEDPVHALPVRLALHRPGGVILDKALIAQHRRGFQRLPLVYERAFTGLDLQDNPLGVEADAAAIVDPVDPSRPAGFGPIARAWPARRRLLGGTPCEALEGAIVEIPEPFDWSYFQAAPPDQQVDFLDGDEWILLEGLHPVSPRIWTRLPGARAAARIHGLSAFGVREGQPLELHADTLRIDGDDERCTVVWRRSFSVTDEAALPAARIVAGIERAGVSTAWPEPQARRPFTPQPPAQPATLAGPAGAVVTEGADPTDTAPTKVLRIRKPVDVVIDGPPTDEMTFVEPDPEEDEDRTQRTVLPFAPAADGESAVLFGPRPPVTSPGLPAPPELERLMSTVVLAAGKDAAARSKPALPFHDGALPASQIPPSVPLQPPRAMAFTLPGEDEVAVRPPLPFLRSSLPAEPAQAPGPAIPGAPWSVERAPLAPAVLSDHATMELSDALPDRSPEAFHDRPASGPKPRPPAEASIPRAEAPLRLVEPAPPQPVTPPETPSPAPVTNEAIGLETFAAITAELAERRAPRGEVLGAHGLSDARWMEAEKRWTEALAAEATRGERALLEAHDDAFVKAWQAIHGPFEIVDYARLTLSAERGNLAAALDAMAIRRTTWMRLKRVYARRIAADTGFAARVKQALAEGRRGDRR